MKMAERIIAKLIRERVNILEVFVGFVVRKESIIVEI